jgi:uncharacterized RDD family membrane protein YckC
MPGGWFYVDQGQQRGPVDTADLAAWIQSARLPRNVPVWREGLAQWTPAEALPELTSPVPAAGFFLMGANGPEGPVDTHVILEWARAGHIGRETLLWRAGLPQWITAGALPEIAPHLPAAAAAPRVAAPVPSPPAPVPPATAREARPAADRDGPCPLCGDDKKMGKKARKVYDWWICRKCSNAMINRRHLAYVLDLLVVYVGLRAVLGGMFAAAGARDAIAFVPILALVAFLFKDGFGGRSPGKVLTGLKVVDADSGQGAGIGTSFKRNLPLLIPFAPIVAAIQLNNGPRLGDGWANTRVVWLRHAGRGPF